MKKIKLHLHKFGLITLFSLMFLMTQISCNKHKGDFEGLVSGHNVLDIIDINSDLSKVDFEDYVVNHQNFGIKLNDTLIIEFKDIVHPKIDDTEADVVYSTSDSRGHITFGADRDMYFIYNEDHGAAKNGEHKQIHSLDHEVEFSIKGALYNDPSIAAEVITREQSRIPMGFPVKAKRVLESTTNHAAIVFTDNRELKKLSEEEKNTFALKQGKCGVKDDATNLMNMNMNMNMNKNKGLNKHLKRRLRVYTLNTALSNSDINWCKLYTVITLQCAYLSQSSGRTVAGFHSYISTYFNSAQNGQKIVLLPASALASDVSLLHSWNNSRPFVESEYNLLLTNLSFPLSWSDSVDGVAFVGGRSAWANVSGFEHTTASHEVGHMFGALHTSTFYQFPWWRQDNMTPGRSFWCLWTKKHHLCASNREIISLNITDGH